MRLLPRSLFGRMVLILLIGLVVAQVLSATLSLYERDNYLYRVRRREVAQRIGGIVRLLDSYSPAERHRIVEVLDTPRVHIVLDGPAFADQGQGSGSDPGTAPFVANLRTYLGANRSVSVEPDESAASIPNVHVRLRDGTWVSFYRIPRVRIVWPRRLLLNLLVLLLVTVSLLLFAVRWVTRPLSVLAHAAEELGRNINRPPLREEGPVEVRRAARAFNQMQVRLVGYLQSRGRILAAMSHDLKTPITRLRLRTELLDDTELKSRFARDLEEMEAMVSSTLDFMRGVDKRGPAQSVDIMALLESLQTDAQEIGQDVVIKGVSNSPCACDPQSIRRCISNLIDNAVKYGKRATILVNDSDAGLEIVVRDEGPGIPEDKLKQVLEPFVRLEGSRNRETGGTGLGLTIAHSIADAHGGKLTLRNAEGGGLEARLFVPRTQG
ncbi:MAG: ATP-binding protein [Acidiferrobacterales bacterium]